MVKIRVPCNLDNNQDCSMPIHPEEGPPGFDCSRIGQLNMNSSSPHASGKVTWCMIVAHSCFLSEQDLTLSPARTTFELYTIDLRTFLVPPTFFVK